MNKRIQELNLQAMSIVMNSNDPDGDVDNMYVPSEFTKKFAELIVRECAERLMQDDFGSVKGVMSIAGARLKEHFGVEE